MQKLAAALMALTFGMAATAEAAPTSEKSRAPARVQTQPAKEPEAAPDVAASTLATPAQEGKLELRGYRSALFGMSEAEVRNAIQKDFGLSGDKLKIEDNPGEQTKVLSIAVPDLLQGGGTARVAYIFGFKTKVLIQVAAQWSKATDDQMTPDRLFSNANILRSYFLDAGYKPDTIVTNALVNGGLLMFRGSDTRERTTMLLLQGQMSPGDGNQRLLTPSGLLLLYMADAKNPDVFRLPPGQF